MTVVRFSEVCDSLQSPVAVPARPTSPAPTMPASLATKQPVSMPPALSTPELAARSAVIHADAGDVTERHAERGRDASRTKNDQTVSDSLRRAKSASPKPKLNRIGRSQSLSDDHSIKRRPKPVAYPAAAAAWLSQAEFEALDIHCQRALSAFAALPALFAAGKEAFPDHWEWTAEDTPLRDIGQRGKWRNPSEQDDAEFFPDYKTFQQAFNRGELDAYMRQAVGTAKKEIDATSGPSAMATVKLNRSLNCLRKQAGQVLLVACDSMQKSIQSSTRVMRDRLDSIELEGVFNAITKANPDPDDLATLRAFVPEANRRAIRAFIRAFTALLDEVRNGARHDEQPRLERNSLLGTFYGIATILLGFDIGSLSSAVANARNQDPHRVASRMVGRSSNLLSWLCNGDTRFDD